MKLGAENLKAVKNEKLNGLHKSIHITYTILRDVSIYVVGKDEYDGISCMCVTYPLSHYL